MKYMVQFAEHVKGCPFPRGWLFHVIPYADESKEKLPKEGNWQWMNQSELDAHKAKHAAAHAAWEQQEKNKREKNTEDLDFLEGLRQKNEADWTLDELKKAVKLLILR